jgi:hypothetical protein
MACIEDSTNSNSESSSSALEAPPPRAYRSTDVQTDPTPIAKPHVIPSPHRIPLSIPQHPDQSPTQLPSPVSADHAREVITDALVPFDGADVDDVCCNYFVHITSGLTYCSMRALTEAEVCLQWILVAKAALPRTCWCLYPPHYLKALQMLCRSNHY